MGDYAVQTFTKCVQGLADAAIRGREPSPTTQENCAVAERELKKLAEKSASPSPKTGSRKKRQHPPRAYSSYKDQFKNLTVEKETRFLFKVQPNRAQMSLECFLETLKSERVKEFLKIPEVRSLEKMLLLKKN